MQRVIVTVQRDGEARGRDLEVPAEVPASRLAELIAAALRWTDDQTPPAPYRIEVRALGRSLQADESLAGAGVWDGAWLVLYPDVPATGFSWRRLDGPADQSPADAPRPTAGAAPLPDAARPDLAPPADRPPDAAPGERQPAPGYVWKQLDE